MGVVGDTGAGRVDWNPAQEAETAETTAAAGQQEANVAPRGPSAPVPGNMAASLLAANLKARFEDPNRLSIDFSTSGPKGAGVDVLVGGKQTQGQLCFDYDSGRKQLDRPAIEIDGKRYLVSDHALDDLLMRAGGMETDAEESSQTKVLSGNVERRPLGLLDGLPRGTHGIVDVVDGKLKVLTNKDFEKNVAIAKNKNFPDQLTVETVKYGITVYYHDEMVKLKG